MPQAPDGRRTVRNGNRKSKRHHHHRFPAGGFPNLRVAGTRQQFLAGKPGNLLLRRIMPAKAKCQKAHAIRRLRERRGFGLTGAQYEQLCVLLDSHLPFQCSRDVKFLLQASLRVSHWALFYKGEWMVMIYDAYRRRIVTVLPSPALRGARYHKSLKALRLRPCRRGNHFFLVPDRFNRLLIEAS
jgi:hypothetical protein